MAGRGHVHLAGERAGVPPPDVDRLDGAALGEAVEVLHERGRVAPAVLPEVDERGYQVVAAPRDERLADRLGRLRAVDLRGVEDAARVEVFPLRLGGLQIGVHLAGRQWLLGQIAEDVVDGVNVRDAALADLRRAVGYVSQDIYLFDGTVRENLLYGAFDASEAEMLAAARDAEVDSFARDLPDGYDTRIGERGVKLPGGQRQRISIARAMLQDPRILVLDEATSAVDTETERAVQRALARPSGGRTTLVVAHRLSTVRGADTLLVLEDGRVTERGSHDELLAEGGKYATLGTVMAILAALLVRALVLALDFDLGVAATGQTPLVVGPIVGFTLFAATGAAVVYAALVRLTERPVRNFAVTAATFFAVMVGPLATVAPAQGVTTVRLAVPFVLHVVVAVPLVAFLVGSVRP